jgi:hypothetical protein
MIKEECIKLLTLLAENKIKYNLDLLKKDKQELESEWEHGFDYGSSINQRETHYTYLFTYILNKQLYYIRVYYYDIYYEYDPRYIEINDKEIEQSYSADELEIKFYKSRFNKFIFEPQDEDIKLIDSYFIKHNDVFDNRNKEDNINNRKTLFEIMRLVRDLTKPAISIIDIIETMENN